MATTVATELTDTAGYMNLKAFKKRRGRPPKYLNIWRQEYLIKMAAEHKIDPVVANKLHGMLEVTRINTRNASSKQGGKSDLRHNEGHGDSTNRMWNAESEKCRERANSVSDIDSLRSGYVERDEDRRSRSAENSPVDGSAAGCLPLKTTRMGILDRESLLGIPCSNLTRQKAGSSNQTRPLTELSNKREVGPDENEGQCTPDSGVTNEKDLEYQTSPLPVEEQFPQPRVSAHAASEIDEHAPSLQLQSTVEQPLKRRPGRPPGSTKKFKGQQGEEIKRDHSTDAFSLRKFFEAGGRDYTEYLEWLKTKQEVPTSTVGPSSQVSFSQLTAGANGMSHNIGGHRIPPLLSPPSAAVVVGSPGFVSARPPLPLQPPHIPAELIHCHPLAGYHNPIIFHVSPNTEQPVSPELEPAALDLSAKKKRCPSNNSGRQAGGRSDGEWTRGSTPRSSHSDAPIRSGNDLSDWDVEQVVDFVSAVPGCQEYAEIFREHMIDGATLPHLSEDHLLKFVSMKLGPAIRLKLAVAAKVKDQSSKIVEK